MRDTYTNISFETIPYEETLQQAYKDDPSAIFTALHAKKILLLASEFQKGSSG
jgi:hypothetical protein